MLDPRVYRAAFVPAAFALIVAAFSLQEPPRGSGTSLAPDAFVGARAFDGPGTGLRPLATAFPRRRPGSAGDDGVASRMVGAFRTAGLETIIRRFSGRTATGERRVAQAGAGAQFARLAEPMTLSEQGMVAARGLPAVLVTVAGERGPGADRAVSQDRMQEMGRSVLRTVTALDGRAAPIAGPQADVFFSRKLVPAWALRLVVGALILPALVASID